MFVRRLVRSATLSAEGLARLAKPAACFGTMALLSACATHQTISASQEAEGYEARAHRSYAAPGSASDPWGPYIVEAAAKYDVPERWIREVMRVESGGRTEMGGRPITSGAGAMGLMQVMPATFDELRGRYPDIGGDPYDPHNSILAGSAYIRELYDLYGNPGFLAAYNGGPGRLDDYLTRNRPLPDETRRYVAKIGPYIADAFPARRATAEQYAMNSLPASIPSGPRYATAPAYVPPAPAPVMVAAAAPAPRYEPAPVPAYTPAPVEVAYAPPSSSEDAAFEPPPGYHPALPSAEASGYVQPAYVPSEAPAYAALPTPPVPPVEVASLPEPPRPMRELSAPRQPSLQTAAFEAPAAHTLQHSGFHLVAPAMAAEPVPFHHLQPATGQWAIQVGAFGNESLAHSAVGQARDQARDMLAGAHVMVAGVREPHGTLYRARLGGLSRDAAMQACQRLSHERTNCMVISPDSQF